ncbi:excinuclease ABC subunit C [bacterium (Candidatus Howlettbacteria) CG_4_10_14_0_8_um_filter_40_9]|nr:MAG: excinuclease ABC subunit C [bacterium (Candidatus Howlettbacteria) CG_4_10_14_0_8_um_filter_40_9]
MYYVYVLLCKQNGDLYIGYSEDLKQRFQAHNNGKVKSTKSKRPLALVYYEAYKDKSDATKREKFLKPHQQREFLRERIRNSLKIKI